VDGIDFEVRRGECFGLVGPNGAGKTTTIKMLATLLPPTAGEAEVAGHSVRKEPRAVRAAIGYVPQSVSVDGLLTGSENLRFYGRFYGLTNAESRVRVPRILSLFGLAEAADRQVATYSGGMVRRLEIGLSILHEPAVVFLDEPTVGLDPVSRKALWGHIQALQHRSGLTILMTTHYLEEAEHLCGRIAIMNRGRIAAMGTLADLRRQTKLPGASLDRIFTRVAGGVQSEHGDFMAVKRGRRLAQRLG
jgi:ABC-2 type transport system ATP-binding protein